MNTQNSDALICEKTSPNPKMTVKRYVIYIGQMEFPAENAAAQSALGMASLLKKTGFETIFHGLSKDPHSSNDFCVEKEINGYKLYESAYPSSVMDWAKFIVRDDYLSVLIKQYGSQNIHAVIAYNYPAIAMARMCRLCSKYGINFVSNCTEWYGHSVNIVKNMDTFLRMKIVNNYARNVICISDYLELFYIKRGCHTVNIPSLIDNNDVKWVYDGMKYIPNKPRSLVYVGSPGKSFEKDRLDWLIEVLQKVKNDNIGFNLNIIGATKDQYLSVCPEQRMLIEGLKNEIVFHGRLSNEEAIKFIKKADYSVFFRGVNRVTSAGFPTKLAESFACGTPVITNPTSNISKYLINGMNGYLAESDAVADLYRTMKRALLDSDSNLQAMNAFCLTQNPLHINNFIDKLKVFMGSL